MWKDSKYKTLIVLNIVLGCIAITALTLSLYLYNSKPNFAYVNNSKLLEDYNGVKEAGLLYEERVKIWKTNLDTLESEINQEIMAYKNAFSGMSTKEKQLTEKLIKRKQLDYTNYKNALEKNAKDVDAQLTTEVLNQIDAYLLEYGKKHKYDYVFGVTDNGNILFAKDANDITEKVLNGLNNNYKGE